MLLRPLWLFLLRVGRRLDRHRSLWFRALMCYAIGLVGFWIDYDRNYDTRFAIRPAQKISDQIVVVTVNEREWTALFPEQRNVIRPLKEITSLTDSFFWHEETWQKLLTQLLEFDPKVIGVTFYFGDNVENLERVRRSGGVWTDRRVIWSADSDSTGRALYPAFADAYASNVGLSDFKLDTDTTVRSFILRQEQVDHMSWKLAHFVRGTLDMPKLDPYGRIWVNFIGPTGTYPHLRLVDVLRGHVPPSALQGKIVVIGAEDTPGHKFLSPVGPISKAELIATTTQNWLYHQWISKTPPWLYFVYLAVLLGTAIAVMVTYPQAVALLIVTLLSLIMAAFSAWAFDMYNFWLPVQAPIWSVSACYILFLSYELSQREKETWRLEQEKKYLTEIEQLKHNFVSLISHDLKTPIARIQGVVDRILANPPPDDGIRSDLNSIRLSSNDLHRYIQTILQISKVESRDFKVLTQVVDINELIEQVLEQLHSLALDKKMQLEAKLEPMFSIEADPTLIREVLVNLLENAIKYTPDGGQIVVTSEEKDDKVRVTVSDNGPGIPYEEQSRIWEKFYRGQEFALKTKGTGLGMYLVKYFVELHKGRVFLQSTPGVGTTVGFWLPIGGVEPPKADG
jgi:two-component system phosphate regulon sensor histidine kinase PhoR